MGNRFWEFYLVRYLSGTIFGIIILTYLFLRHDCEISKVFLGSKGAGAFDKVFNTLMIVTNDISVPANITSFLERYSFFVYSGLVKHGSEANIHVQTNEFTVLAAIVMAIAGFLYMYISSMPILLLHSLRIYVYRIADPTENFKYVPYVIIGLALVGVFIFTFMMGNHLCNLAAVIAIILIIIMFVIVRFKAPVRNLSFYDFYMDLSKIRAKGGSYKKLLEGKEKVDIDIDIKNLNLSEYIESYRHLREHGNAFGILFFEIVFAFYLVATHFNIIALAIWFLFGFISWFIGTYLEIRMVDKKGLQ